MPTSMNGWCSVPSDEEVEEEIFVRKVSDLRAAFPISVRANA